MSKGKELSANYYNYICLPLNYKSFCTIFPVFIQTLVALCFMSCYWLVQGRDECDKFFLTIEKEPEYFVPKSAYIGKLSC